MKQIEDQAVCINSEQRENSETLEELEDCGYAITCLKIDKVIPWKFDYLNIYLIRENEGDFMHEELKNFSERTEIGLHYREELNGEYFDEDGLYLDKPASIVPDY